MQQIKGDGGRATVLTLIAHLQSRDLLDTVGGEEFVAKLASEHNDGRPEEIVAYVKSLKSFSLRRRATWAASKLNSLSGEPLSNAEFSAKARDLIRMVEDDTLPQDVLLNPGQIVEQVGFDRLFNPMLGQKPVDTQFAGLNEKIIGFFQATLNVIAANTSVGKSTWMAQVLHHNAKKGIPCALFSLEMKRDAILRRLISSITKIPLKKYYKNELTKDERNNSMHTAVQMQGLPLKISNLYGNTTAQIEQAIRVLRAEYGSIGMVAIDHLQLMRPLRKHATRHHEIGEITNTLKQMSMEFDTRIMLLSQMNRGSDKREDKSPTLSDLKESGDISQDADTVIAIHRPEMRKRDGDKSKTELHVLKNRDGELGICNLRFEGDHVTFYDADY